MKAFLNNVTVSTTEDAVKWLITANNCNTDILKKLIKANKRIAFGVGCVSVGLYFTGMWIKKSEIRMAELEKEIEALKEKTSGDDIPESE